MQLFRRAWCPEQNDKKPEKALAPKSTMRSSSMAGVSPLLQMKRKRGDSPEPKLPPGQELYKKRKIHESGRPSSLHASQEQILPPLGKDSPLENIRLPEKYPSASDTAPTIVDARHAPHNVTSGNGSSDVVHPTVSDPKTDSHDTANTKEAELRNIIEHQVNLEILLKHRELRLIEQELAKCQVALEQLRRCELVPYPGTSGLSVAMSDGTGPSIKAQIGFTQPQSPAPWGVADGPYTRHYSRWLLNDTTFDSVPIQQVQAPVDYFSTAHEGRSTRNSGAGVGRASKGRPSRDSVGNFSHALPNYPTQARGKGGPLVIKRLADNKFVKLICNNCNRSDFSSVQGFLNHCRIAHKVDYKSHEAAATDCGHPLEDDEIHLIPQNTPLPTPAARTPGPRSHAVAPAPAPAPVVHTPAVASVHPLNAPVMAPRFTWKVQAAAARAAAVAAAKAGPMSPQSSQGVQRSHDGNVRSAAAKSFQSTPLVGSSSAPYLSSHFAKRGLGGDIQAAASRARERFDLGPDGDEDDSSANPSRKQSVSRSTPGAPAIRFAQASGSPSHGRPQSRKGQHAPISRPRPAPLAHQSHEAGLRGSLRGGDSMEIPESPQESTLSPHTADSNPGLVSDHEDDDAVSDLDEARSDRHTSPDEPITQIGAIRRGMGGCGEAMDVDVEVEDDVDGHHEVLIRPRGLAFQEFSQRPNGSTSTRPVSRFGEAAK